MTWVIPLFDGGCISVFKTDACEPPQIVRPGTQRPDAKRRLLQKSETRGALAFSWGRRTSRESNPRCATKDSNLHFIGSEPIASASWASCAHTNGVREANASRGGLLIVAEPEPRDPQMTKAAEVRNLGGFSREKLVKIA